MGSHIFDRLVLGTAGLAGIWGKVDPKESVRVIHRALEAGIDHIDTAPAYADAEKLLSTALTSWKGKPPFISTKVGKKKANGPDAVLFDYSPSHLKYSVEQSRQLFRRDTLDLVFLHDPGCMKEEEMKEAVDVLMEMKERGWIDQLGIGGNFGPAFEPYAVSGYFHCFMGYNRYNLLNQQAANEEFPALKKAGVPIWQASPLYMGLLGSKHTEYLIQKPEWIPEADLQTAATMKQWCEVRGLSLAGLALNYVMCSRLVDRVVIGSSNMQELDTSLIDLQSVSLRACALEWLKRS